MARLLLPFSIASIGVSAHKGERSFRAGLVAGFNLGWVKMRYLGFIWGVILLGLLSPLTGAEESDFLSDFVIGHYWLLGKQVDSEQTYFGKIEIHASGDQLRIKRTINGTETTGTAAIEQAVHGAATVLRMRFEENNAAYENTCLIQSDLDNYARISCYRYQPGVETKSPGLEVLFIDSAANAGQ